MDNCSEVIRLEVAELGAAQTVCPEGTEQRDGQCVRREVVTAPPQPPSEPGSGAGGTSCGTGRYVILEAWTSGGYPNGSGRVRDTRTGLVWMSRHHVGHGAGYVAAVSYCVSEGMRLPTKDEALGIAGNNSEACAFPSGWSTWTATSAGAGRMWRVSRDGNQFEGDASDVGWAAALCVR